MNSVTFEKVRKELNDACEKELLTKGPDYMVDADRLSNFKSVASLIGLSAMHVWAIYFLKHVFSICNYTKKGSLQSEPIESRFADARNYLDLGYALMVEATRNENDFVEYQEKLSPEVAFKVKSIDQVAWEQEYHGESY